MAEAKKGVNPLVVGAVAVGVAAAVKLSKKENREKVGKVIKKAVALGKKYATKENFKKLMDTGESIATNKNPKKALITAAKTAAVKEIEEVVEKKMGVKTASKK